MLMRTHGAIRQRGAAVVEFALILPMFLLIVFGTIQFGLVLYDKAVITNASREAARAGIVLQSPKLTSAQIQTVATNYTGANLVSFAGKAASPTVTVAGAGGAFGTNLTVTVSYTYTQLGLGTVGGISIGALTGPLTLSAVTVMKNE